MRETRITVSTICSGNSSVFHALGIPFSESLELDNAIELHKGDLPSPLCSQPRPTMGAGGIAAIFGVVFVFLGSWAAKKALDEFFTAKIRPKLLRIIGTPEAKALPGGLGKKWVFQLAVWYEDEAVLILLALVGDCLSDILQQESLLPTLHSNAVDWLIRNGAGSPVHLYIAESGKANLKPLTFDHITEAQQYMEQLWPVIIPTSGGP